MKGVPTWFELAATQLQNQKIGFDPALINSNIYTIRQTKLTQKNVKLEPIDGNLVDAIW